MHNQSLPAKIRRLAREEIDGLVSFLAPRDGGQLNVHDARKAFKRVRSHLRLIRDPLGKRKYRKQNWYVRDLSRRFSDWRDREVMVETADLLLEQCGHDTQVVAPLRRLREQFVLERDEALTGDTLRELGEATVDDLATVLHWIDRWPLDKKAGFEFVASSHRRTYRQARRGFRTAKADPTDETLHEWRKRVKYLWTQCCTMKALAPDLLGPRAVELKQLSDYIGDDHDIAVLLEHAESRLPPGDLAAVRWSCGVRRAELQRQAFELGEELFAERAKAWIRRIEKAMG